MSHAAPRDVVLAVDLGLTNCKAVVFDLDGRIVARASVAYETRRPAADRVEQDPEEWWRAMVQAVRRTLALERLASKVRAIGVTAHMHALVCIGPDLCAIGASLVLGDRRATAEAEAITSDVGADKVYETTGTTMDASMPASKIRWLSVHEPERHAATRWFLGCKDYLRMRLTGEVASEPVDACATSIWDIHRRKWSEEIAAVARAPIRALPPVLEPAAVAGPLLAQPAGELGIPPGIPVIVGAGDDVEVLGNGLLDNGACLEHLGTTGSILAVAVAPVSDPQRTIELYPHTLPGLWVVGGSMTAAGGAIDWAASALGYRSVAEAGRELWSWPPPADAPVFVPHLEGARSPVRDPFARGAWVGVGRSTGRGQLALAAFEGVALGLQAILARIEDLVGAAGPITVSAGDSASDQWLQARADVYGRPLAVLETSEPTALGLFTLASAALGRDASAADAARRVVRIDRIVGPRRFDDRIRRLEAYRAVERALTAAWPALAGG